MAAPAILFSDSFKARILAAMLKECDNYSAEEVDKVRAVPVGTLVPVDMPEAREILTGWAPEEMTGEELIIYVWDAEQVPL